jgi:hypothetical protein
MKATQWLQKLAQGFSPGYQRHQQIALKERQTGGPHNPGSVDPYRKDRQQITAKQLLGGPAANAVSPLNGESYPPSTRSRSSAFDTGPRLT